MDLRVERTRKSIINAFIELRSRKQIEKITIKELSELAYINKATFYRHYEDIYALSEELENELIEKCLESIPEHDLFFESNGIRLITEALSSQGQLFRIIFSGSREELAISKIETFMKEKYFKLRPDKLNDLKVNVMFTALANGCFHAYMKYHNEDTDTVIDALSVLNSVLTL